MNRALLLENLAQAERRALQSALNVVRQRIEVASLKLSGRDTARAFALLCQYQELYLTAADVRDRRRREVNALRQMENAPHRTARPQPGAQVHTISRQPAGPFAAFSADDPDGLERWKVGTG